VTPVRSSRLKAVKIDLGAANFLCTARVMRCFVKHDLAPKHPVNSSTPAPTAAAFAIEARPPTGVTDSGSEKAVQQPRSSCGESSPFTSPCDVELIILPHHIAPGLPGVIDAAQTTSR